MNRKSYIRTRQSAFTLVEMIVSMAIFAIVAVVALGALIRIITANQKAQNLQAAMTNLNSVIESMTRDMRLGTNFHCDTSINASGYGNGTNSSGTTVTPPTPQTCSLIKFSPTAGGTYGTFTEGIIAFVSTRTATNYSGGVANGTCNLVTIYRLITDSFGTVAHLQKAEQTKCGSTTGTALSGPNDDVNNSSFCSNGVCDVLATSNITLTGFSVGIGPRAASGTAAAYKYITVRLQGYAGSKEREKEYFDLQTTVSSRVPQS